MTVVHTRPRRICASTVREGDQIATYVGTGDLAGIVAATNDAPDHIDWRYVSRFDQAQRGVMLSDGTVKRCDWDEYVVVRELVSVEH
jgi:hypothetical protein